MMKFTRMFTVSFICLALSTSAAFAHSGGTDAQGGHHDYKNVSGLGSYHYHHGYPAHLHPNGVCPYETSVPDSAPAGEPYLAEPPQENQGAEIPPVTAIKAVVNGTERTADMPPRMMEDRIMIAAQSVFAYFDAQVTWDISGGRITCGKNQAIVVLTVDSATCLINGVSYQMERPPVVIDGCLFLPAREIAEGLGYHATWNSVTNTIEFSENSGGTTDFFVSCDRGKKP